MGLGHRAHQPTVNQLRTLAECDARAMESAARAMQEAMVKRIEEASSRAAAAVAAVAANSQPAAGTKPMMATPAGPPLKVEDVVTVKRSTTDDEAPTSSASSGFVSQQPAALGAQQPPPPPAHLLLAGRAGGVGAAHIKLSSRNDGRSEFDTSIVASMEVNGIVYQGVLFAQNAFTPNAVGARI